MENRDSHDTRDHGGEGETTPLLDSNGRDRESNRLRIASLRFVLTVGFMSFFADCTYEGSCSILGQYLPLLGAGPLAISIITGFGEFLGYALRLVSGSWADQSGLYWPIIICGYILQMSVVPLLRVLASFSKNLAGCRSAHCS